MFTDAAKLWALVRDYAKQETLEPLHGLGRWLAFGLLGSLAIGLGVAFIVLGALRGIQDQWTSVFDGNWSFAPYVITLVIAVIAIVLAVTRIKSKGQKT